MKISVPAFLSLIFLCLSCSQTPPAPVGPLPSERQLAWHEMEFYAFAHFNMNTFTNKEWGYGNESPELFNPTGLDCRQWARVCKEAGIKGIILTAKHHDGFCLWPSAYTEHSVKNSPWKNGKGDVVRELSEACREYGLKMGIYLSPWDRNHADYGKPEYITYFRNQLRELLTNYGDIFEVWFDGANGGTGWYGGADENRKIDNRTYYDWENTRQIVRELQPGACMFSDGGPDVRWVGNEEGWAGETNWCLLKAGDFAPGLIPDQKLLHYGQPDGTHWLPAEVDVSIRPGWYYHPSEDIKVKTLPQLLDIYYHSIGRNASFLLNFPIDNRGLIHENDVAQIQKLASAIKADFAEDLAPQTKINASATRENSKKYSVENLTDGNPETYWATNNGRDTASVIFDFGQLTTFNRFLVQEYIKLGQRVKAFTLEAFAGNEWKTIASETTIGYKRILRFPDVSASKLRFSVTDSKACPVISNVGIFKAPKVLVQPGLIRNQDGMVTLSAYDSGIEIFYTTDGTEPGISSEKYSGPFEFLQKGTIWAVAVDSATGGKSPATMQSFDIPKGKWKLLGKPGSDKRAGRIFDGNPQTALNIEASLPADFDIDLGETVTLKGITYLPSQSKGDEGVISSYKLFLSADGRNWGAPVAEGEFANIKNNPVIQSVNFKPVPARFVRLRALTEINNLSRASMAEFDIISE